MPAAKGHHPHACTEVARQVRGVGSNDHRPEPFPLGRAGALLRAAGAELRALAFVFT
jgi:hypothetical protein